MKRHRQIYWFCLFDTSGSGSSLSIYQVNIIAFSLRLGALICWYFTDHQCFCGIIITGSLSFMLLFFFKNSPSFQIQAHQMISNTFTLISQWVTRWQFTIYCFKKYMKLLFFKFNFFKLCAINICISTNLLCLIVLSLILMWEIQHLIVSKKLYLGVTNTCTIRKVRVSNYITIIFINLCTSVQMQFEKKKKYIYQLCGKRASLLLNHIKMTVGFWWPLLEREKTEWELWRETATCTFP